MLCQLKMLAKSSEQSVSLNGKFPAGINVAAFTNVVIWPFLQARSTIDNLEGWVFYLDSKQYRNNIFGIYYGVRFCLLNFTWLLSKSKKQRRLLDRKCFIEALAVVRKSKHNVLMIRLRISWLCKNMHKMVGHVKIGDNETYKS